MRFRAQFAGMAVGLLLLGTGVAESQPSAPVSTTQQAEQTRQEMFKWFDTLGYPDVKGRVFVRVDAAYARAHKGEEKQVLGHGWVLEEKKDEFIKVFTLELSTSACKLKTQNQGSWPTEISYQAVDIQAYGAQWLANERQRRADERGWPYRSGKRLSLCGEAFLLARVLALEGNAGLSAEIYACSEEAHKRSGEKTQTFQERLADDFAEAGIWEAMLRFDNLTVRREDLLKEFETLVQRFPKSKYAQEAGDYAAQLKVMVQQDKAKATASARDWKKMTLDEQARELVYQLRDQNGHQRSQPGSCDVFADPRGEESPAGKLLKMSYDAVPALIDALDDETLTRSLEYHRSFFYSHHVVRVGKAAERILSRIAFRSFRTRSYTHGTPAKDDEAGMVRSEVKAWWEQVQAKGIQQVLVEAVESGDDNSQQQAYLLVERYPQAALAALKKGYEAAPRQWTRNGLVAVAGKLKTQEAEAWLAEVMLAGGSLGTRVKAARALSKPGGSGPVEMMIAEWKKYSGTPSGHRYSDKDDGFYDLLEYLAESRDAGAIGALGQDLDKRGVEARIEIINAVGRVGGKVGDGPASALLEALWVGRLGDKERWIGISIGQEDMSFSDPRACDMAAMNLRRAWPERYKFKYKGTLREQDSDLVVMQNVWRKAHGQEELALPAEPVVAWLMQEEMTPAIQAVTTAGDDAARNAAVEGLVSSKGLRGIKAVCAAAAKLPENDRSRAALEKAALRMASIVSCVVMDEKSVEPGESLAKALKELEGKELTPQRWVDLLMHAANHLPVNAYGFEVECVRDVPGVGVWLHVNLPPDERKERGAIKDWRMRWQLNAGKVIGNYSVGSSYENYLGKPDAYKELTKSLGKALEESMDTEIRITFRMSVERW